MKYNLEAESNILGSIINSNDLMCDAINLEPTDFYKASHELLFMTMKGMYEKAEKIDITTLINKLGTKNLEKAGGISYISQLIGSVLSKDIKPYVKIVKECSDTRRLTLNLTQALKKLEQEETAEEVSDFLQSKILNIASADDETGELHEVTELFIKQLEERYRNGGKIQGIPTRFSKLDVLLGGLKAPDLIIVAARPSMGKSVLATNISKNVSLYDKKNVALFSLEMGKVSLLQRMIADMTSIDSYNLRDGKIADKQWIEIVQATEKIKSSPLKLFEQKMTLNQIYTTCKKLKIQHGLDVVIIDYLQLISGVKAGNREQEISQISRRLKLMAKELNCVVIALSQLSRACESRTDKRPMLSDLRESGSIEQDADIVMFLYRDEYYNAETEDKGIVELIVAKQREGKLGRIKHAWMPQYQRIANLDFEYEGTYRQDTFKK